MKILVIDDEESIRFTFENFLTEAGHSVTTALCYSDAVQLINLHRFDLIFSDIMLGGKTGIEVLRAIRETDNDVPVVMITGHPTIETAAEAVRLGAFDYIQKPVNQEMLLKTVRSVFRFNAVQQEKNRYQSNLEAIFRSVKDSIITVGSDLTILDMNDAASAICGATQDLCGKPFHSLTSNCNGKCLNILQDVVQGKKHVELNRVECERAGRPRQVVNLCASPLLDGMGNHCGAVLVARDESRLDVLETNLRERKQFHNIVGGSEKMQQMYAMIENLADVQSTILICSESGTGKELVAEALHYKGKRNQKPMIKVNCSALSENLLESELFGHVKGAFTGAIKDRVGRFERADCGTIFLDEIGDISPGLQVKLLRVLQEKEFERVGDTRPIRVDARIIAATNQDLTERVRCGTFREDLYYRLNVVKLSVPPLRERLDDLELLTDHFLRKFSSKFNKNITSASADAMLMLRAHPWPGNVRELEHTLEYASIMCPHNQITVDHLPADFKTNQPARTAVDKEEAVSVDAIIQALEKAGGNKSRAAQLLGISRRTIYRKLGQA
jgi:two-component system, NtrC family, response regulator HydG